MNTSNLIIPAQCVGCKSFDQAMRTPTRYNFDTRQNLSRFAARFCVDQSTEIKPQGDETYSDAYVRSLCTFGKLLLKADAITGVQERLGMSARQAEDFLGYSGTEL